MMYTLQTASEIAMMNKELIMKYAEDPAGNRKLEAMDHVTFEDFPIAMSKNQRVTMVK